MTWAMRELPPMHKLKIRDLSRWWVLVSLQFLTMWVSKTEMWVFLKRGDPSEWFSFQFPFTTKSGSAWVSVVEWHQLVFPFFWGGH